MTMSSVEGLGDGQEELNSQFKAPETGAVTPEMQAEVSQTQEAHQS